MIIPRPVRLEPQAGHFVFGPATSIRAAPGAEGAEALLREALLPATGLPLPPSPDGEVRLTLDSGLAAYGPEAYELRIGSGQVSLTAASRLGLLHGVQTIRQLLPPQALARAPGAGPLTNPSTSPLTGMQWRLPCGYVLDYPRFPWRGFMLDVARHFQPARFVRGLIDVLALHKINILHLHLTDDQGWRLEIGRYPALTEVGAWRTESMVGRAGGTEGDGVPHGGFYTQAELRALVAYAADRGIQVIPEIGMPGHTRALLAAYPHLGNDPGRALPVWTGWGISDHILGPDALPFCEDVLAEVMKVFPDSPIHLGGDECPTTEWVTSPRARARSVELGLAHPAELYGWFMRRLTDFVLGHGRRPICWDEAAQIPALPSDVTIMAWREQAYGLAAAGRGHPVIMAPRRHTYLDYAQSDDPDEPLGQPGLTTLADVYTFDPLNGRPDLADRVLGTQAQMWTEFTPTPRHIEYMAFPRLCALAEVAWSPTPQNLDDFIHRMTAHARRLDALGHVTA